MLLDARFLFIDILLTSEYLFSLQGKISNKFRNTPYKYETNMTLIYQMLTSSLGV